MSQERIIIIGAGVLQMPAIEIAQEMGLYTIVCDYNREAPGMKIADYTVIVSTRDVDGNVRIARELASKMHIHGVITAGTDASMTVAAVANALNLPGIKFEDASAATNKIKMRERFAIHKVPQPGFFPSWTYAEALAAFRKLEKPVVVKPADNMGSRGVMKVEKEIDMLYAFQRAKSASPSGEVIVEEYMDGPELSIDMLIHDGTIHITGVADRIIEYPPYFVETGHILPSALPQKDIDAGINVMKQGIAALNLTIGSAKGDIKITSKGAMVGEIAARLSGGFMSAYTYPLATGVNLIKNAIEVALGKAPSDLKEKHARFSMEKALIPGSGIVQAVEGVDRVRKMDGVVEVFLRARTGDILVMPTNNLEKAGNVIVWGNTRDETIARANAAVDAIKIKLTTEDTVNMLQLKRVAREKFAGSCRACRECDGEACRGEVPGIGGIGTGDSFVRNVQALKSFTLNTALIHGIREPNTNTDIFTYHLELPLIVAPVHGTNLNMGGGMSESDFAETIVEGAREAGIIAMVGESGETDSYRVGLKAIQKFGGYGIPVFKPVRNQNDIIKKIKMAEDAGCVAVAIDIDAGSFLALGNNKDELVTKTEDEIRELTSSTALPIILKGIMSLSDAKIAVKAGAKGIYISNKGGRVLESSPATVSVLPEIGSTIKNKALIITDGGFRNGADVLKGLALSTDIIGVGRPMAIAAYGGGARGVQFVVGKFKEELMRAMILTGVRAVKDVTKEIMSRL
ncbi:MAG: alpha-hydroxy-acid oxidizing protein [Spirochaetes bacterium]|nr:alpha-hydroxy-acid oxidizing protein [Spirochaetota bacterium]